MAKKVSKPKPLVGISRPSQKNEKLFKKGGKIATKKKTSC